MPESSRGRNETMTEATRHPTAPSDLRRLAEEKARAIQDARKQAEEQLADLNRRKDEFLAMLSHELRNPLAPILNAVQLLQLQKGENAVQQKARAIIERQVRQLTHLVNDLLDVARTATGRIQLCREPVAVSDIVERAVETARPLIDQRRHELTVSLPPDPIWLYADASRLEQVVTNLLSNAAKYTTRAVASGSPFNRRATKRCCVCGIRASASLPLSCPTSSTCSRKRNGHPTVRKGVGDRIGLGQTAGGNARGNRRGFQYFGARQRVRRASCGASAGDARAHGATGPARNRRAGHGGPCGCWSWMTTWMRRRSWKCWCKDPDIG
jgi:two-component sensor histidine kinase